MSAYYATPDPFTATEQEVPAPVLVTFPGPAPQSRVTVAFRFFMALPHLIVLALLGIAAWVIAIIGWFGALFTGRLPVFAAEFLTGYLRWHARVDGYAILLTDVYPPFSLEDVDYPIRVAVMPGRLNRLAVLFRFILLIPCWILQSILAYGAFSIVQFVSWLIVLIKGEMPRQLHQALAAVLRYQFRVAGFALMLTSAYPGGLFGDPEVAGEGPAAGGTTPPVGDAMGPDRAQAEPGDITQAESVAQAGDTVQAESGHTTQAESGDTTQADFGDTMRPESGAQAEHEAQPEFGALPGYPAQPAGGYEGDRAASPWRLVLSSGARKLVIMFIVLGVIFGAVNGAAAAIGGSNAVTAALANRQLQSDIVAPGNAIDDYRANITACKNQLACVTKLDRSVAATLHTFADKVRAIRMPSGPASGQAVKLASAASHLGDIFARLGAATTKNQYFKVAQSSDVQGALLNLNQTYVVLHHTLTGR